MRILLAGEGYHILEAENGLRALELYRGQTLVYSSFAPKGGIPEKTERDPGDRVAFYEWSPGYTLNFADGEAEALLYYNGLNDYYSTGCDILNMLCLLWWFPGFFLFNSRKIIRYILQLSEEIRAMEGGDLEHPITVRGHDELTTLASCLDSMRLTLRQQQEEEAQASAKVKSRSPRCPTTGGTTTYPVTIRIDDTGDLLPGMNATAEIDVASAKNALTIPNGAVVRGNYVLVTQDSPSASAPTAVTVAGTSYTVANSSVASQLSSLNGGGVGQVVTLLLGMNNEAVAVLTGEQADEVFYGVVQTAARSLVEETGADVQQKVTLLCTDGTARTVNIAKDLNYPAGWLVKITVDESGEQVESLAAKSTSGAVKSMQQLLPAVIDKVGAASVMSGGKKYESADDMQVYLWYKGTYYPTTLSQVNSEDYSLIGWYDASGSAAGGKIRVLIAVKKD